jgi:ribosomal protein S27AE
MCLSAWALLWLCGPGAFLVLSRKKRRRAWARTHCTKCGYERGPSLAERCPECGHAWAR